MLKFSKSSAFPEFPIRLGLFYSSLSKLRTSGKLICINLCIYLSFLLIVDGAPADAIIDNNKIRFGSGTEASIGTAGIVKQPFYYNTAANSWRKLTYSVNPLDYAIGLGGDGASSWNINGTVTENPTLTGLSVDDSGFTYTSGNKGYGTLISTGSTTVGGSALQLRFTYVLGANDKYIQMTTRITNNSGGAVSNLRFWIGTRDDWVGTTDSPRKQKGSWSGSAFTQIVNVADQATAILISSGQESVIFYTNSGRGNLSVASRPFSSLRAKNPETSGIDTTGDNSYGYFLRMNDLANGASDEITLVYLANEAPSNVALTSSSISENQVSGTTVGTLSSTDSDTGDSHTYSLVSGTGGTDNASFTISGNSLKTAAAFDVEAKSSYSILVRSTDRLYATCDKILTITVTNVNEVPTDIVLTSSNIAENQASGTTVGTFSSVDPDTGDSHAYTLVAGTGSNDNASFTISGNSLKTSAIFNYEAKNSYAIRIRTTDASGLTYEEAFTITVTNANDSPIITEGGSVNIIISEDSSPTAFSLTLNATDEDAGSTLTWSISTFASNGTASASGTGTSKAIFYTPIANYNGADSFLVQVSDGTATDTITVNVSISAVNDTPVIAQGVSISYTINEDNTLSLSSANISLSDVDLQALAWTLAGNALQGNVTTLTQSNNAITSLVYTPNTNYNGSDNFTLLASDGTASANIRIEVTLNAVNDAPVITQGEIASVTMSEDSSPTAFSLTLNATDAENNNLAWSISSAPNFGTASVSSTATGFSQAVSYTPPANYNGTASFVVQVSDGTVTDMITVNVTISPVNDTPVIAQGASFSYTINEDSTLSLSSANISVNDVDLQALTWTLSANALQGNVTTLAQSNNAITSLIYTPNANYNGSDNFTLQASDGSASANIRINVTVNAVNDAPAITQGATSLVAMSEDSSPTAFSLTLNATDIDTSDTLTWSISTAASRGTASVSGTGASKAITYTPTANANGIDSFVVQVSDGNGGTANNTVTVTVNAVNDVPTITEGATSLVSMSEDNAPTAFSLTLSATDIEASDTLTWSISTAASRGTASVNGTGASKAITYTPTENAHGTDSFVVQVSDGNGGTANNTVTVTVNAVNDVPTITQGATSLVAMSEDSSPTAFSLTLNATDIDTSDTLTWSISTAASRGTASVSGTGASKAITYTPTANANGTDSFVVQVSDGNGGTANNTVTVTVNAVNDIPVLTSGGNIAITENAPATVVNPALSLVDIDDSAVCLSANVTISANYNSNQDTLAFTAIHGITSSWNSATGMLSLTGNALTANYQSALRSITYINSSDNPTSDLRQLVWVANDGFVNSANVVSHLSVGAVNDAPVITQGATSAVAMSEDSFPAAFSLTLNATDLDTSDNPTWSISTAASHGTASASGTGSSKSITYTPTADYNGTDSFVVQVSDGNGGTAIHTVTVTISAVNDAPIVTQPSQQTLNSGDMFSLSIIATDVDGDHLSLKFLDDSRSWLSISELTLIGKIPAYEAGQTLNFHMGISDGKVTSEFYVKIIVNALPKSETPSVPVTVIGTTELTVLGITNLPLEEAMVQIYGQQLRYTDRLGKTSFSVAKDLSIEAKVSAKGYESKTIAIKGSDSTASITLTPAPVAMSGVVSLFDSASPLGAVVVASANVSGINHILETSVSGNGYYSLFLPQGSANWMIGSSLAGYASKTVMVATTVADTAFIQNFALVAETQFSWKAFQANYGDNIRVWVTSNPSFSAVNISTALTSVSEGNVSALTYDATNKSLTFQVTPNINSKSIQVSFTATPTGGVVATLKVDLAVAQQGDAKRNLQFFERFSSVAGTQGQVSLSGLDTNKDDLTAIEVPAFGVSANVNAIRVERVQEAITTGTIGSPVYSIEAYQIDANTGALTKVPNSEITEIYLTFNYDPTTWNPAINFVSFSENGGLSWVVMNRSDMVAVDPIRFTVTVRSNHLSMWTLSGYDGLHGHTGGSTNGGGCLLK